jgi:UDP-2,3-diacylglucosamine pyrophosphatase LpxH
MHNCLDVPSTATSRPRVASRPTPHRNRHYRTIFISDIHLGTRGCKADLLADFLTHHECRTLYLVGDIIDGWALKQGWFWSPEHSRVVDLVLRKAEHGTRVIYIPGNHDEDFRKYCGLVFAGVELKREAIHQTADGQALLVIHGDHFDAIITCARWLALLGDRAYTLALVLNDAFNCARRRFGLPYWSLSAYLKRKVKNAVSYISSFEHVLAREAKNRGLDGVVCGHIHHAETKMIDGILYCNDGDWVESCTALVEDARGRLEIVEWTKVATEHELVSREMTHVPPDYVAA